MTIYIDKIHGITTEANTISGAYINIKAICDNQNKEIPSITDIIPYKDYISKNGNNSNDKKKNITFAFKGLSNRLNDIDNNKPVQK